MSNSYFLTVADAEVLDATARSLAVADTDPEAKLAALHFTHSVLLKDFPPEVLLQRPALIRSLVGCLEDSVWQIQLASLQCLVCVSELLCEKASSDLQPHSTEVKLMTGNGRFWATRDQPIQTQTNHPYFTLPADPLDTSQLDELKPHELSIQQFASLLLTSPLASLPVFNSEHTVMRTAAADLLNCVLQLLKVSVSVPLLWQCYENCTDISQNVTRGGDLSSNITRVFSSDAEVQIVQDLVSSIKYVLESVSMSLSSSNEKRCSSNDRVLVQQHCSAFIQSRAALVAWLHTFAQPAIYTTHLVTVAAAEAVVLAIVDIDSLLQLLPAHSYVPKQSQSSVPPHMESSSSSSSCYDSPTQSSTGAASVSWAQADLSYSCLPTAMFSWASLTTGDSSLMKSETMNAPEDLVTLLAVLAQIDKLSHNQVCCIVSVSCSLQSCVAFMRCSSSNLPAFLELAFASLPSFLLHTSKLYAKKLLDGLCKQYAGASALQQSSMRAILLHLLSLHSQPHLVDVV
ncbi:uncharacterized protein LOC125178425 [Hyalella azteca]|uniref:Uncharacterized protein LOC125178425 n=1 Tax=Hyalella azteca TaxID=294128 RepID=A0A979FM20_HYAAZ|nr:uncharacterized protein LOC125178425 [Hyalella azteca]